MWIAGIVVMAIGGLLLLVRRSSSARLAQMQSTETSKASELEAIRADMERDLGPGSFIKRVEVKGKALPESPLRAEFTGTECVYYSAKLERRYEETYWDTDSEGRRVQRTRNGSEILASNARSVPFHVDDGTGRVKVLPDGAEFVTERSLSRFERGEAQGGTIKIGSFAFSVAALGGGRRTLGYQYTEDVIPSGRDVYVLGEAASEGGGIVVKASSTKGERFIISAKSEEELVKAAKGAKTALLVIAAVLGAVGAALVVAGLIS
jgi:hypothetical protein